MIEFHQTNMGHKFFQHDVPALIKALNKIAEQLEITNNIAMNIDNKEKIVNNEHNDTLEPSRF